MKLLVVLLLCFLSISLADEELKVKISQGELKGSILKSRNEREYLAFLGIPYAQPPIGILRFSNPVEADSWSSEKDATSFGNICPQYINGKIEGNEDCLFLNVYCPKEKKTDELPVMVWIHGGYFIHGSSSDFSADYFMDKDVILVTLNYRLGIFGFFTTGDASAPGNFGLKDQVLALKWVQKNINAFGGNPKKVTLFGQSAGGASVSLHALSKASEGLFQQYIIQSGSSLSPWAYQNNTKFKNLLKNISLKINCAYDNAEGLVTCLRTKTKDELIQKTNSVFEKVLETVKLLWTPTNEPEAQGAFLTDSPQNLLIKNGMADLPFISGILSHEGLLVTNELTITPEALTNIRPMMRGLINFVASKILEVSSTQDFYTAIDNFYFNNNFNSSGSNKFKKSLTDMFTFGGFIYPELRMLECGTKKMKNSNYLYSFGYEKSAESNGVPHGAELSYLFPKYSKDPKDLTENIDKNIRQIMLDLWTSFGINGKPTSNELTPPDLWKPYKAGKRVHLQIGNIDDYQDPKITLSNSFYPKQMKFWQSIYSKAQFPTCVKNRNTRLKPFTVPSLYVIIVVVSYYIMK